MTADNLESLTPAQLGEVFAVECAGWQQVTNWEHMMRVPGGGAVSKSSLPPFATSADAVLPFAEKHPDVDITFTRHRDQARYVVSLRSCEAARSVDATLAGALCKMLIRAARAQKASTA